MILVALLGIPVPFAEATGPGSVAITSITPATTLVSSTDNTVTLVYTALGTLSGGGISITAPPGWSAPQGSSSVAGYTTASTTGTIGLVFDEAESITTNGQWTTNGGACSLYLNATTTIVHSGSRSIACVNNNLPSGDGPGGKYFNNLTNTQDWSAYTTVGFWIYTDTPISNGRLAFEYASDVGLTTLIEPRLSLGSNIDANVWTHVSFTFTAAAAARIAKKSYGFEVTNNSVKGSKIYTDGFSIGSGNTIVPGFSGRDILISAITLVSGNTITVTYGTGSGAGRAVATSTPGTSTFIVKSRTDEASSLDPIGTSPTVTVVDTTSPTVSVTSPASDATIHGNAVTLSATASDNVTVAGVKFYVNNILQGSEVTGSSPYSMTWDSTATSSGSKSIIAVARDSSNNYATSSAVAVTLDNIAPVISSVASTTAATTATVTWTTDESSNSKVSYGTVSGTYTSNASSASFVTSHTVGLTGLSGSTNYYYVVVSADDSGNTSTSTEKVLRTTDSTAPTVSLTAPIDGAMLQGSAVALTATASDNEAVMGVKFYIDGVLIGAEDVLAPYTGILDSTSKSDGSHSIVAVARDNANNFATSTSAVVTIDNVAPTAAISYSINHAVKSGDSLTITATFSEPMADSPVPKMAISGANTVSATDMIKTDTTHYTFSHSVGSGNGVATVSLSVGTDAAGTVITSTPTSGATFTIDNIPPSTPTIASIATDNTIDNGERSSIHVVGTAEADSLVSVTLSDGANSKTATQQLSGGDTTYDITINGTTAAPSAFVDGTITPSVTATDVAGNISSAATTPTATQDSNNIGDNTAPTVSLTAPLNGAAIRGSSVSLAATASDNVSLAGVKFYIGGVLIGSEDVSAPYTGTLDSTSKSEGSHSIVAVARDTSNNYATSTGVTVTVDNTAPVVSGVSFSPTTGVLNIGDTLTMTIIADAAGYTASAITINGVSASAFHDSGGGIYTVTYIVGSGNNPIAQNVQIPISVVLSDLAGNTNAPFTTSPDAHDSPSVNISDHTKPDVSINQTVGQADPASSAPIVFNLVWSEQIDVDTFSTADITQNGTAGSGGITWVIADSGDHRNFTLTATAISGDGTVEPSIRAGAVEDLYGNSNNASSATDNTVTYLTGSPTISEIVANPSASGATVRWTTDQDTSTRIWFGLASALASSTSQTDLSPLVTSHTVRLANLVSCTTYHYQVVSVNAISSTATSTDATFTTRNCADSDDADVLSQASSAVTRGAGGNLALLSSGKGLTLDIPSSFASDDANFQIKKLNKTKALNTIGAPSGYQNVGNYVYDLHALSDVETAITTFNLGHGPTVTFSYAASDIVGINESTLKIFRNDTGTWAELTNCSVNTSAHTITCTTSGFSIFSIFGQGATEQTTVTNRHSSHGGITVQGRYNKLISLGNNQSAQALVNQYPNLFASQAGSSGSSQTTNQASTILFTKDLKIGLQDQDVLALQRFLNSHGYIVANSGAGSSGSETSMFGRFTQTALIKFQKENAIQPAIGYFGPITRKLVNQILSQ